MRPLLLAAATLLLTASAVAQSPNQSPVHIEGLGTISFPNSGNQDAQDPFYRGVMLLHSFEFSPAAAVFREAQEADPTFALAFWGEALTYNHPLWRQQDRDSALEALARLAPTAAARRAMAGTDREKQYLDTVEILYGPGEKTDRDQLFMASMKSLHEAYPDDDEAAAFYALSILGSSNGERDFATYMRAAAVAMPVFNSNPNHPGAAHYLIHSFDDPIHAPLGLPAAIAYSEVAPAAAHAQHMTSHIFVAMGDWDRVIAANIRASGVQDAARAAEGRGPNVCGHYSSWLHYGYLMTGDLDAAEKLMNACHAGVLDGRASWFYFVQMRARHVIDTQNWALAGRWKADPPRWSEEARNAAAGLFGGPAFTYGLTDALAALRLGDPAVADSFVKQGWEPQDGRNVQLLTLRGLMTVAEGDIDGGLKTLGRAATSEASMPFEFGPPVPVLPAHEALGAALLAAGNTGEARAVFTEAVSRTPGRKSAVDGLRNTSAN